MAGGRAGQGACRATLAGQNRLRKIWVEVESSNSRGWVMSNFSIRPQVVLYLLLCFAVLFAGAAPVWAQSATTGSLTGTVTDPSGAVISGATIAVDSKSTGQERTSVTDASGVYKFSLLPPGNTP